MNMYKLYINNDRKTNHFPTFPQCISFLAERDPRAAIMLIKKSGNGETPTTIKSVKGNTTYRFQPTIEHQQSFQITEKFPGGNLPKGEGLGYKFIHS